MAPKRTMGRTNRRRTFISPYTKGLPGIPPASQFNTRLKGFLGQWVFGQVTTNDFWRYFQFQPGALGSAWNEHATVFDEYKIWGVTLELRPNYDNVNQSGTSGVLAAYEGSIHHSVDPSSSVTLPTGTYTSATLNNFFQQSQNVVSRRSAQGFKTFYKPKVASQIAGVGLTGKTNYCPWIKCTSNNVEVFNGVHIFIQAPGMDATKMIISYDIYVTAHVSFRGNA